MNKLNIKEKQDDIFIGQGVTYSIGSDSYAYSIIDFADGVVTIQRDKERATANSNYYGSQKYVYYADPKGRIEHIRLYPKKNGDLKWTRVYKNEKTGRWNKGSKWGFYKIGYRRFYQDPSF